MTRCGGFSRGCDDTFGNAQFNLHFLFSTCDCLTDPGLPMLRFTCRPLQKVKKMPEAVSAILVLFKHLWMRFWNKLCSSCIISLILSSTPWSETSESARTWIADWPVGVSNLKTFIPPYLQKCWKISLTLALTQKMACALLVHMWLIEPGKPQSLIPSSYVLEEKWRINQERVSAFSTVGLNLCGWRLRMDVFSCKAPRIETLLQFWLRNGVYN